MILKHPDVTLGQFEMANSEVGHDYVRISSVISTLPLLIKLCVCLALHFKGFLPKVSFWHVRPV